MCDLYVLLHWNRLVAYCAPQLALRGPDKLACSGFSSYSTRLAAREDESLEDLSPIIIGIWLPAGWWLCPLGRDAF